MNVSDLLDARAIAIHLDAKRSTDVIKHLGGILHKRGYVKDNFIEATLAREASMPTGLPLGGNVNAAIPHVDIEYVNHPAIALATLVKPVIFQNMVEPEEDVPVQLVIMLALDQPKSQIEMLQQVVNILQSPAVIDQLMLAESAEEVCSILRAMQPSS
jgi:PTS system galactitol-specific IIA component